MTRDFVRSASFMLTQPEGRSGSGPPLQRVRAVGVCDAYEAAIAPRHPQHPWDTYQHQAARLADLRASATRWSSRINVQVYPTGSRRGTSLRRRDTGPLRLPSPSPVPSLAVGRGLAAVDDVLRGPWQLSVSSPPLRMSWLPSMPEPINVSLPARPEIVSPPRPPLTHYPIVGFAVREDNRVSSSFGGEADARAAAPWTPGRPPAGLDRSSAEPKPGSSGAKSLHMRRSR
jgi:hypothetical protein